MRTRLNRKSSSDGAPAAVVVEVSGSIRTFEDATELPVVITVEDGTVRLQADDVDLGVWATSEVNLVRLDSRSFEFVAEGDRLIFTPEDAAALAEVPALGARAEAPTRSRKSRRAERNRTEDRRRRPVVRVSPPKPRKAKKAKPEKTEQSRSHDARAADEAMSHNGAVEATPASDLPPPPSETPSVGSTRLEESRESLWLRTVDTARRNHLFQLDRIPVDISLRGEEHEHTWSHGAAARTGLGSRICTICGKIRR